MNIELLRNVNYIRCTILLAMIVILGLTSCSSDQDADTNGNGGQPKAVRPTIILSDLNAEIGIQNMELRALTHPNLPMQAEINKRPDTQKDKYGEVTQYIVPKYNLSDGDKVQVHTFVASTDGYRGAATLTWIFKKTGERTFGSGTNTMTQSTGTLVLGVGYGGIKGEIHLSAQGEADFSNEHGRQWYVAGIIGGQLVKEAVAPGDTIFKVKLPSPSHELTKASRMGDVVEVTSPFSFAWTKLTIKGDDPTPRNGYVDPTIKVNFKPRGSFISYRLGNFADRAFKPNGFTVTSDAFSDNGWFEFRGLPSTPFEDKALQIGWVHSNHAEEVKLVDLKYTFKAGHEPNLELDKVSTEYYSTWVMGQPDKADGTEFGTQVMIDYDGASNGFKVLPTDYEQMFGHKVVEGRAYTLTASARTCLGLPIEYVAHYNLAGNGSSLNGVPSANENDNRLSYNVWHNGHQLEGTKGAKLRMANITSDGSVITANDPTASADKNRSYGNYQHDARLSGYYNWYVAAQYEDFWPFVVRNSTRHFNNQKLQVVRKNGSIEEINLRDEYHVPGMDEWAGIFPGGDAAIDNNNDVVRPSNTEYFSFINPNNKADRYECFRVGVSSGSLGENPHRASWFIPRQLVTRANYSDPVQVGNTSYVYGIRFIAPDKDHRASVFKKWSQPDDYGDSEEHYVYDPAENSRRACVYEYARVNDHRGDNASNRIVVRVIWIGEIGLARMKKLGITLDNLKDNFQKMWNGEHSQWFPFHYERVFPTASKVYPFYKSYGVFKDITLQLPTGGAIDIFTPTVLVDPYLWGSYWSRTWRWSTSWDPNLTASIAGNALTGRGSGYANVAHWEESFMTTNSYQRESYGMPIRLFFNRVCSNNQ